MRKHLGQAHNMSLYGRKGRPTKRQQERRAQLKEGPQPWIPVACQRFFPSRQGSQYFQVLQPDEVRPPTADRIVPRWDLAVKAMEEKVKEVKAEQQRKIVAGGDREVNQWLERAGWDKYLADVDVDQLLDCIAAPDEETERQLWMIWHGIDGMVQKCQQTVVSRAGLSIRFEAVRTEKHQTKYTPLAGYMDRKAVVEHARPWKQILMFIGRTQGPQEWKKPKYQLKKGQKRAWRHLWQVAEAEYMRSQGVNDEESTGESSKHTSVDKTQSDELSQVCLDFCWTLLQEQYSKNEYDSVLVCGLAVLGVRKSGGQWCWAQPYDYPPILSRMIKIARFMVIEKAFRERGQDTRDSSMDDISNSSGGDSDGGSEHERRPECLKLVQRYMDQCMIRGTHGAMQWMLDLRTYGLKIHYNTTAEGCIDWVGEQISWKGSVQFTMQELREMVHKLIRESREILFHDLMLVQCEKEIPKIPWSSLRDNPRNEEVGWSYLEDERNSWPVEGQIWLQTRIRAVPGLPNRFIKDNVSSKWDRELVRQYLDGIVRFRGLLLVLMHITGGQPARGPEITGIQHCNGVKGRRRNIFIEQNTPFSEENHRVNPEASVLFVTQYYKGYSTTGKEKIIHRYLPRMVGELYIYFDWLVRPFQEKLGIMLREDQALSALVWPTDHRGKGWDSPRMTRVIEQVSRRWIGVPFGIRAWRELAIGISRRYMRQDHAFDYDEDDEKGEFNKDHPEDIHDIQAGHGPSVAGNVYSRGIMEVSGVVASMRERFYQASREWHRFLGVDTVRPDIEAGRKRKQADGEQIELQPSTFIVRGKRLRRMDMVGQLKKMMGVEAEFRGCQQAAIQSIIRGENCVVQVMGTGGGKSLSFMLPAWSSPRGVSIVVVPLIALRADMLERCRQLGIPCAE